MNQYLRRKIWTLNRSGKFRGYLRTVSGYPVTLTDCMAGQPVSMAVDGNAVQDGTPTPDNPVDVQLCGDNVLSEGYTAVEYIESTGEQWIDTNFHTDQDSGMYFDAQITEIPENLVDNGPVYFGGCVNNNFSVGVSADTGNFVFTRKQKVGATINGDTGIPANTNRHIFMNNFLNNHCFILDTMYRDVSDTTFSNNYGMAIFRTMWERQGNYYNAPIKARIYRFKLSQGNEIIADLYPAKRDSDGEIGMYDIVQDVFYTNSGTGEFIAGNGICAAYKVSGRVEGLNLLSNNENDWVSNAGTHKYFTIPVEGTTTLQAKIKEGKSIPKGLYLGYSKQGTSVTGGVTWLISNGTFNVPTLTSGLKYISIYPKMALDEIFDSLDIMLIEGAYTTETMPAYEPYQPPQDFAVYLPEQIAKVGDVADEVVVDMENRTAELKKNVGSMTMSDSYSGGTSTTDELVRFWHSTTPRRRISPSANIIDVMSDIYEADTWNNIGAGSTDKQFVIAGNPNTQVVNVRVPKSVIGGETNELMNAWAANNPATVYYVLAEPVTTDITSLQQWDAMPSLWSGTAVITADTVIAPSAITAKYYASKPEEVN